MGCALAILASLSSCGGSFSHREVVPLTGALDLPPSVGRLLLRVPSGSFELHPTEDHKLLFEGQLRIAANTEQELEQLRAVDRTPRLEATSEPGTWQLHLPGPPAGFDPVMAVYSPELRLSLPPAIAVDLEASGSGNLGVIERQGAVRLRTSRGDLRLARCRGAARIHTGSGNVIVDRHWGDLDVDVGQGDIQAFVPGPGADLRLVTGLGNAICYLPPDAGFRADVRSMEGTVASGFGLPIQAHGDGRSLTGLVGDGRTAVVIRTGRGRLALNRRTFD